MLVLDIPKETTFDLPEGNFRAQIEAIKAFPKQSGDGMEEWVRILFNVDVRELKHLKTMAGRNFKANLHPGSELRNFLGCLLGSAFFLESSGKKLDLESLVGLECIVTLVHFQGREYDKPMVVVASVLPISKAKSAETRIGKGKD